MALRDVQESKGISEIDTKDRLFYCLWHELGEARQKFPNNKFLLAALTEEVGELSEALLSYEIGEKSKVEVFEEAIQVAAMALRIAQEGTAEFNYDPDYECYAKWGTSK